MKEGIVAVMSTIDGDMLQGFGDGLGYRIDVCRVTRGVHIEHL